MSYRIFAAALPAALLCCSLRAQTPCSMETVRGVWVQTTGVETVMMAVGGQPVAAPVASLGLYSIDEQGRIAGWSNSMLAGEYSDVTVSGRVEVSPACTGTIRFSVKPFGAPAPMPGEAVSRIVVLDNGNEMRAMTVAGIMGKSVGTETYRRVVRNSKEAPKCTAETVRGTYGSAADGIVLATVPGQAQPVPAPYSGLGAFVIDGRGGLTGNGAASMAGQLMEWEMAENSIQVMEDCTAYIRYRVKPKGASAALPGESLDKWVILDGGEEIRTLGVTGKSVVPAVMKRISKDPAPAGW